MKILITAVVMAIASPALAQAAPMGGHSGHAAQAKQEATTACTPEHAAMGHCKLPEARAAKAAPNAKPARKPSGKAGPHAGHKKTPTK